MNCLKQVKEDISMNLQACISQILEGKANLLRLTQEIRLNDEERAAIDEGVQAYGRLLEHLATAPILSKNKMDGSPE
jgi:hypothetical protein